MRLPLFFCPANAWVASSRLALLRLAEVVFDYFGAVALD